MQNSELYRRGVVVPIDAPALLALRASNVTESTSVVTAELDEASFGWLWDHGLFARINASTGAMLDDYEEHELEAARVGEVLRVVKLQSREGASPAVATFLADLTRALETAVTKGMPVFFIL